MSQNDNGCISIIVILVSIPIFVLIWNGIKPFFQNDNEMYNEEFVETSTGNEVCIIHEIGCKDYSSWYGRCHKMSFIKKKYQIYCSHCIDDDEAYLLNHISKYNIKQADIFLETTDEDPMDVFPKDYNEWDRTSRTFSLEYVIGPNSVIHATQQDTKDIARHIIDND